jgi:hypothetical protein
MPVGLNVHGSNNKKVVPVLWHNFFILVFIFGLLALCVEFCCWFLDIIHLNLVIAAAIDIITTFAGIAVIELEAWLADLCAEIAL